MLQKCLLMICSLGFIPKTAGFNISRLVSLYIDACGETLLCFDWPDTDNFTTYPGLLRCPSCSCEDSCFQTGNCCPDKFFQRPLAVFDSPYLYISDKSAKSILPKYEIISTCPDDSYTEDMTVCGRPQTELQFKRPVTSLATNFSYYNIFCAFCHGEKESDLITWNMALDGMVDNFINFIETDGQLLYFAKLLKTTVIFTPPSRFQDSVKLLTIDSREVFMDFHPDLCKDDKELQKACSSSYLNTFRLHRNIFCYICSFKKMERTNPVIDSCLNPLNKTTQKCLQRSESNVSYPYKNFYCYLCNVPSSLIEMLQQNHCTTQECGDNLTPDYYFVEFSSDISDKFQSYYYLSFKNITFTKDYLLQFIRGTHIVENINKNSNEVSSQNLKQELKSFAAKNPHRICNQNLLPDGFNSNDHLRQCDCSYSCLFEGKCTCCVDTALMHPIECITPFHFRALDDHWKLTFQIAVVSSCFKNNRDMNISDEYEKIRHLCETNPFGFNILIWSNSITYKNIFCFLCNTDISVESGVLKHDSFEALNFTIVCISQLNILNAVYFKQVLQEAKQQDCGVIFDSDRSLRCQFDETHLSHCPQNLFNHPVKRLCENTSVNSFVPVGRYKNEFCYTCNSVEFNEGKSAVNDCATSKGTDQERMCQLNHLSYNSFLCPECVDKPSLLKNWTIRDCAPEFGSKLMFTSQLIRELFSPSRILKAVIPSTIENEDMKSICYPGRILRGGNCVPIITNPRLVEYTIFILTHLSVESDLNDTRKILTFVKNLTCQTLKELFENPAGIRLNDIYFLPKLPFVSMSKSGKFQFSSYVDLHFKLSYFTYFNRDEIERKLLEMPVTLSFRKAISDYSISFSLNGIKFSNLSEALLSEDYILEEDITSFKRFYTSRDIFLASPSVTVIVSPLLLCKAKKITKLNVIIDKNNFRIIEKNSYTMFFIGEFVSDFDGIFRVCIEDSSIALVFEDYTDMLEMLTTILNIISIVSMITLLVLYTIVPGLQTLPGLNIMSTTCSILCMQLTYTVANAIEKSTLLCAIVGVMLHYFWLSMCCCLFICSLHMCRSFTNFGGSMNRHGKIRAVFIRYVCFCYITPIPVIAANIVITFSLQNNIGYGTELCFVENFVQNLVTFIVPLLVTCVVNAVMFTITVINIKYVRNINKSKEDKSELLIFIKLFSLTGIIWIFQMLDGILHMSMFSFVATILTSSQGTIIFLSFASSPRIYKHLKSMTKRNKVPESKQEKSSFAHKTIETEGSLSYNLSITA